MFLIVAFVCYVFALDFLFLVASGWFLCHVHVCVCCLCFRLWYPQDSNGVSSVCLVVYKIAAVLQSMRFLWWLFSECPVVEYQSYCK